MRHLAIALAVEAVRGSYADVVASLVDSAGNETCRIAVEKGKCPRPAFEKMCRRSCTAWNKAHPREQVKAPPRNVTREAE